MAILEEIAVSASKQAKTNPTILITNGQHKNSPFSGQKTRDFGRSGGFWYEYLVSGARKRTLW
ncbi:TPA: hypothetical protein RG419_003903 [Morganella morganii]|nr:hypothetical protein [Morganella morganii]